MSNPSTSTNRTPYLRVQRNFPQDSQALSVELNKSYIDIANSVNSRTIGIFPTNAPVVNGETWFLSGSSNRQQALRQVFQIKSFAAFNHGITFSNVFFFSVIRGIGFDGTNYYPLPFVSPTAASQVGITVTPTQVVFNAGGSAPAITSGFIVLEWISLV